MGRLALVLVVTLLLSSMATPADAWEGPTLFDRPVTRAGVHFEFGFGVGVGTDGIFGLHHTMELGGTLENGMTIALLHTFIQSRGFGAPNDGPDLIGGWMAELKVPLFVPEIVVKAAFGLGGEHDQSDGIRIIAGVGWVYGVDLHLPVGPRHGPTLGLTVLHTVAEGRHSVGFGAALGWTLF